MSDLWRTVGPYWLAFWTVFAWFVVGSAIIPFFASLTRGAFGVALVVLWVGFGLFRVIRRSRGAARRLWMVLGASVVVVAGLVFNEVGNSFDVPAKNWAHVLGQRLVQVGLLVALVTAVIIIGGDRRAERERRRPAAGVASAGE